MNRLALLGCGWLGLPLGSRLVQQGYIVGGSTRRAEKLLLLEAQGIRAVRLDLDEGPAADSALKQLLQTDILLLDVPPGRRRSDVESWYPAAVDRILRAARSAGVERVLFTSSTGVYGDAVDEAIENQPPRPTTASGRALEAAEAAVRSHYGEAATILRLAGLIGPGRHPGRWFAGKSDLAGGNEPVNLVHLTDVIGLIEAVLRQGAWGHTLNICADEHPRRAVFYTAATRALGLPVPTFATEHEEVKRKRIDNNRAKSLLKYQYYYSDPLQFPELQSAPTE